MVPQVDGLLLMCFGYQGYRADAVGCPPNSYSSLFIWFNGTFILFCNSNTVIEVRHSSLPAAGLWVAACQPVKYRRNFWGEMGRGVGVPRKIFFTDRSGRRRWF